VILETTLSGIIVFTGVILLLVLLLNLAQAKLLPQGDVTLHINDDSENDIVTTPGSTLLTALATENVFFHLHAEAVEHVQCASAKSWKEAVQFCPRKQGILVETMQKKIGD
jgi:Na+-transporting NADH:ubiquinone oxidoreductase subunit NqrF